MSLFDELEKDALQQITSFMNLLEMASHKIENDRNYSDINEKYTKKEEERVKMIADLAAELSSMTAEIQDLFQMLIVPHYGDTVEYQDGRNILRVPVGAPLLKTVLSVISEMDRARYEWATPRGTSQEEKYALLSITNRSGHYLPQHVLVSAVGQFHDQGVRFKRLG